MTTTATLVQLAAELTLFLVAVAGAGLSIRQGLLGLDRAARLLLGAGFLVLAVAAFLVGSLTVDRSAEPVAIAALRIAGGAIVALGVLRWAGSRIGRPALLAGLLTLVVAAGLDVAEVDLGSGGVGSEPLVLAAALVMGGALVVAGRHTIPGRIGTSVAAVLLAVILVVSLALSAVISATVEDEALRRYGSRASAEAAAATAEAEGALDEANLVAASVSARLGPELEVLATAGSDPEAASTARAEVTEAVSALVGPDGLAIVDPVVLVSTTGVPEVAVPDSLGGATRLALGGDPVVQEALEVDGPRQGVTVVGADAFAVAAAPVRVTGGDGRTTVGAVVVAHPLDVTFLRRRTDAADPISQALVTREGVVATTGAQPPRTELQRRARTAIDTGQPFDGIVGELFVVARPVAAAGLPPQMAVVLSTPTDRVGRTREDIYRSLFVAALVAGLAGLALAVVVGERIGGAIRLLTSAATRIREGDLDARAAVDREDELGELSTTFDAMAGSVRDLTGDLRRAAATERGLRARLETVFAGVTEAVVAADDERRVTEVNRAARELLGLPADHDAVGRPLADVLAVRGPDGHPVDLRAAEDGPLVVTGSVQPPAAPAGEVPPPVPVVGTVASLHDVDGTRAGTVVVLRDVRREQALEEAKQDFLANIGHELRTPLTPIKGYAGVLRRRTPNPAQAREWADGITSGVDRLEHLVERLVTFAAVTAGPATDGVRARDEVDLGALADDVVGRWRTRLSGERALILTVAADLPPVAGQDAHLRLALGELVDNAVRFSAPGTPVGVAVTASPAGEAPGGAVGDDHRFVALTVVDGGGVDTTGLLEAVDAFNQGDASATRSRDGLGLGLALTDRIARAHGGRLRVAATSHGGTSVSILVPVVTPATDEAPGAGPRSGDGSRSGGGPR
ncbi:histidine kinase dimerization/phospho-acceptor domain-containing protein [Iamia sp.]|uniref:histidine kinase dimerization/phospho-acceptor domain-containing protein n=1 Tax=Iamia sp. TaxID=2722710 RepID=UPI002B95E414|nr:histidine kinase dimerization/phospho-acceptor domain-containing protein [Iamia sp.]HXH58766.1 histidine kinase dimerization/phospho-acceptor domain-containing protein [Iamia sp.]